MRANTIRSCQDFTFYMVGAAVGIIVVTVLM